MRLLVGTVEIGEAMEEQMSDNQVKFGMFAAAMAAITAICVVFMVCAYHWHDSDNALETYKVGETPRISNDGGLLFKKKADDK